MFHQKPSFWWYPTMTMDPPYDTLSCFILSFAMTENWGSEHIFPDLDDIKSFLMEHTWIFLMVKTTQLFPVKIFEKQNSSYWIRLISEPQSRWRRWFFWLWGGRGNWLIHPRASCWLSQNQSYLVPKRLSLYTYTSTSLYHFWWLHQVTSLVFDGCSQFLSNPGVPNSWAPGRTWTSSFTIGRIATPQSVSGMFDAGSWHSRWDGQLIVTHWYHWTYSSSHESHDKVYSIISPGIGHCIEDAHL